MDHAIMGTKRLQRSDGILGLKIRLTMTLGDTSMADAVSRAKISGTRPFRRLYFKALYDGMSGSPDMFASSH